MKWILKAITVLWRVWFYVAIAIAIVILFPFIFITSLHPRWYPSFFFFSRVWAWMVLLMSGFWPRVNWVEKPERRSTYIICANHTSMVDIMMTLAIFPNCFLFIGKKELARLPVFGYFYRRTNLLVDRGSISSKRSVLARGAAKIESGIGLCIYPEGGIPDAKIELAPFKNGAFKLSAEKGVTIIPVTFPDNKRHLPYDFSRGYPGILRAIVHPFITPENDGSDEVERLKAECRKLIQQGLLN